MKIQINAIARSSQLSILGNVILAYSGAGSQHIRLLQIIIRIPTVQDVTFVEIGDWNKRRYEHLQSLRERQ